MSASPEDIAKAFVQHYYQTFDTNRAAISGLYVRPWGGGEASIPPLIPAPQKDVSMLSWEGEKYVGSAIGGKLTVRVARDARVRVGADAGCRGRRRASRAMWRTTSRRWTCSRPRRPTRLLCS